MSRSVFAVVMGLGVLTMVAAAYYANRTPTGTGAEASPLTTPGGRVHLVTDEQDIGLVPQGAPLSVVFSVGNTGSEALSIRQSSIEESFGTRLFSTIMIEPGRTGEVTAELWSDELLDRGRKHVLFETSDPTCEELWLTVRGTVLRHATVGDDEEAEQSVLLRRVR
jgi:hypothetical protein